ncbi:hypothetical protein HanPI659440_Chr07g0272111 [Helianthus annuus]|nr:hypothetical protein HanPI659440_Chr07g0272111 [Helianthus annuus]
MLDHAHNIGKPTKEKKAIYMVFLLAIRKLWNRRNEKVQRVLLWTDRVKCVVVTLFK